MKKKIGFISSLGVSGIAIFWLVHKISFKGVEQSIRYVNYSGLLFAALIYSIGFLPRGLRWRLMLSTVKNVSFSDSTQVVVLGYAANNILPFRLGEIVRAYVMSKKNNISKLTSLGSIACERVLDGIVIVTLLGLSMISLTEIIQDSKVIKNILLTGGLIFLFAILALIIIFIYSGVILRIWNRFFGDFGLAAIDNIIHSLSFLRSNKIFLKVLLLSMIVWLIEGAMFVLILWLMGFQHIVATGYFCMGIINLGILLPSAPGYVGVFQAASVFAFLTLGYSNSAGLAYGLLAHLAQYIPVTITGIIVFLRFGYSFNEFYRSISSS
jgi:uncharacterized protein (TIRG00374 family)